MNVQLKSHVFGIVGGDRRIEALSEILKDHGFSTKPFRKDLRELFSSCDVMIFPVPVSKNKITVFSSDPEFDITLDDVIAESSRHSQRIIFGGLFPARFADALVKNGHTVIDIFKDEGLIYKNAVSTAEGALMIAMEKTEKTVISTSFSVLGFGRIGSYLCKLIHGMGGKITVLARSEKALNEAKDLGYNAVDISSTDNVNEIVAALDSSAVIFNTVPSVVIDREIIEKLRTRPLYIELASFPYGIDSQAARELDFNIIYAPSLPGRYAPISAAEYIYQTVSAALEEIDRA